MRDFEKESYKVFDMFNNEWALATAGTPDRFNTCTISWGSLGSIWGNAGKAKPIVTIYIHPTRYTNEFLRSNELFTVSFFPKEHRNLNFHPY